MKKIPIDFKNGIWTVYPSGEELSSIEGYISKAYFKNTKGLLKFIVVIINENKEYTINILTNTIFGQSVITELVEKTEDKINLTIEKRIGENGEFYLCRNIIK